MHLDSETLERALHGELTSRDREDAERHLASCAGCVERLAEAEREERRLFGLLEELDHPAPPLDWEAVRLDPPRKPSRIAPPLLRRTSRSLLAASLAFLLVAAGVLAVIPGTPVREWVESVLRGDVGPAGPDLGSVEAERSGIAVVPGASFQVAFMSRQTTGQVHIRLADSGQVELTVTGEPVGLESGADRLVVENEGSRASYELRIPRALDSIRVSVAGETVLEGRAGAVHASAPSDPAGGWRLDLRPEGS